MKRILFVLIIFNLLPSCFPLYSDHKTSINKLLSQVEIGSTTREEVISILGEPDVAREGYILYLRREYDAGIFFPSCFSVEQVYGEKHMDLYFEFDNYGTLTYYRVDKYDDRLRPVKQK